MILDANTGKTPFNRGKLDLDQAVRAYSEGKPVVVFGVDARGESVLIHGSETLETIRALGTQLPDYAMECLTIRGVPLDDWKDSEWPLALEAARLAFMERGGFSLKRT